MNTQDIINYYANLLIMQYRQMPNAYAEIQQWASAAVMSQVPTAVRDAFDVNTAVGVQLDVLGKYAGISRILNTISSGTVVLSDSDFRTMIKMKVVLNRMTSRLADIQALIHEFFPGQLAVFDYQNMHIDYFFDATLGSATLAEAFVRLGLLPRPTGVQLGSLIYISGALTPFGCVRYAIPNPVNTTGCNRYTTVPPLKSPWIRYSNAIT